MTTYQSILANLQANPDWAALPLFDRTGWKRVRFGDVVENVNDTVRSPQVEGIERVIAMEHLEPGSLHVREWGDVADGTTFTRRCRPGQVLFGKRRAYQRKVAVAEFDAVVSGDIYVLAPKNDRLLSGLLPFLCLSERFFQHAVGTSAGSLSPRTNWSSLASFEFALPPLDQQRRLVEILWAVDEATVKYEKVAAWTGTTLEVWAAQKLTSIEQKHNGAIPRLGDIVDIRTGKLDSNCAVEGGAYPFFTCDTQTLRINTYSFDCEALLLAGNNAVGIYPLKHYMGKFDAYQRTYVITAKDTNRVSYPYLLSVLRHGLDELRRLSVGSATKFLTMRVLQPLPIPLPSMPEQEAVVATIRTFEESRESATTNTKNLCAVRSALVESLS